MAVAPKAKRRISHTKKNISESQRLAALERNALEFEPSAELTAFTDLPISDLTKRGLKKAYFSEMTDIQKKSIPICLKGIDILAAARTGSGKTLAFLVPVLEILYRKKWGHQDGLGALIISPTRELAVQIFDVLRSIGGYHSFSAGLIIGGKNLKMERDRLDRMNLLVATPGRLLQHMDQTYGFESNNLQMLVLDEADRILDMGFSNTIDALLSHLPRSRQTLLFSATQTKSVTDLARLSMKDPISVGIDEETSTSAMPETLEQHYVICDLDKKLDILWSFIKSHLQCKVLVFISSGKQVRFVYETFRRMHPGIPLLHLHGRQKQATRLSMYTRFTSMQHVVLFATDVAARGLDFPSVDWVVQVDAPEDVETYIHRVGRTARYKKGGKGLLLLIPSEEEGMTNRFSEKGINVQKIKIKASKTHSIENHLQSLAFQEPEIKYLGQRAFVSYVRSIYLQKDKSIFKVNELPVERFAASLGLPGTPKIKILNREAITKKKNAVHKVQDEETEVEDDSKSESSSGSSDDDNFDTDGEKETETMPPVTEDDKPSKPRGVRTKYDRMFERKNQNILSEHYTKLIDHNLDGLTTPGDDDDDFITLKRADHDLPSNIPLSTSVSKRKLKIGQSKKAMLKFKGAGEKLIFDEEGNAHEVYDMVDPEDAFKDMDVMQAGKQFAEEEKVRFRQADITDKQEAKAKKNEKKRKRKEREKEARGAEAGPTAVFARDDTQDDDGYQSPQFNVPASSDEESPQQVTSLPMKKRKNYHPHTDARQHNHNASQEDSLQDDEQLALSILRRTH